MKISISVGLWNRGRDLSLLLDNLRQINDSDLEVLICDFNSTDINFDEHIYDLDCKVIQCDGNFNLSKGLEMGVDNSTGDIVMLLDADAVLDDYNIFENIRNTVKEGETFYCPIVSTQDKPKRWGSVEVINSKGNKVWKPTGDPRGSGMIAVYKSDYKSINGLKDSIYYNTARGEFWGGHDGYLYEKLKKNLKVLRPIEENIWLRANDRSKEHKWYKTEPK